MKKVLILAAVSTLVASSVMAADTITGTFFDAQMKKIDAQTSKITNKERELQQKQQALMQQQKDAADLKAKQEALRKQQLEDQKKVQMAIIDKKKQQIQAQKDFFVKQKQEIKNLFTIE